MPNSAKGIGSKEVYSSLQSKIGPGEREFKFHSGFGRSVGLRFSIWHWIGDVAIWDSWLTFGACLGRFEWTTPLLGLCLAPSWFSCSAWTGMLWVDTFMALFKIVQCWVCRCASCFVINRYGTSIALDNCKTCWCGCSLPYYHIIHIVYVHVRDIFPQELAGRFKEFNFPSKQIKRKNCQCSPAISQFSCWHEWLKHQLLRVNPFLGQSWYPPVAESALWIPDIVRHLRVCLKIGNP